MVALLGLRSRVDGCDLTGIEVMLRGQFRCLTGRRLRRRWGLLARYGIVGRAGCFAGSGRRLLDLAVGGWGGRLGLG